MIHIRSTLLSAVILCFVTASALCATHPKPLNILWLGSSSSNRRLRNTLEIMLKQSGNFSEIKQDARGFGIVTKKHLKPDSLDQATRENYDYIVLQISSYSLRPEDVDEITPDVEDNVEYAIEFLKETGSKIILFESFALENFRDEQPVLNALCRTQAEKHNVLHVPTGTAWQNVANEKGWEYLIIGPDVFTDRTHAGPRGTYLFASMFYSAITAQSPVTTSSHVTICRRPSNEPGKRYNYIETKLPDKEARYLQETAEAALLNSAPEKQTFQ